MLQISILFIMMSVVFELIVLLLSPRSGRHRTYASFMAVAATGSSASLILLSSFSLFSILFFILCIFRMIVVARVVVGRMHNKELYSRTQRSLLVLYSFSLLVLIGIVLQDVNIGIATYLYCSLVLSTGLLLHTIWNILRLHSRSMHIKNNLEKLPTVSICIPARNETQDLPECIESMLGSTYPKLEILVLDDCSHDKTPVVIKDYAHKGVRFLSGEEPPKHWLAKNAAMNKLFDEATGEVIIFAGVDVRFQPDTVLRMVEKMHQGFQMMSVLPRRNSLHELSLFIQPLRYWWEIVVPRFFGGRPPVLSTCWAIDTSILNRIGGFNSVKRSVQPEAHFAKKLRNSYAFILAGNLFGLASVKAPQEQLDTALRTRYPQVKHRPETVLSLLLIESLIFLTPVVGFVYGLVVNNHSLIIVSLFIFIIFGVINITMSRLVVSRTWFIGAITWPFLYVLEVYVLIRSMLAYEFGDVIWKERNICFPMLTADKELPKL